MDGLYSRVENEIKMWANCMSKPIEIKPLIPDLKSISVKICDLLELNEEDVLSKSRKGELMFARQLIQATAVAFKNYYKAPWTVTKAAEVFGGVKHEIVLHSAKKVRDMIRFKYNLDKIRLVADEFNLSLSDYHYSPSIRFTYGNIVFKNESEEFNFKTTSEAAKFFNVSTGRIVDSLTRSGKLKRKYVGSCDIIKSNYD